MNSRNYFETEYVVGGSECDCFGRLHMSALLNCSQGAAMGHTAALDIGRDVTLGKLQSVWMIVRTRVELKRPVLYGETLRVRTWPVESKGATLPREEEFFVGDESVGSAHTVWVLANVNTRRLLRPKAFFEVASLPSQPEPSFPEPKKPSPIEPLGEAELHRVRYTDLDMNRHVHNTRYLDFAANHLELEKREGKWVRAFTVNFSAECVAGETLAIASADDGERVYVRGSGADGRVKFELELLLADI